MTNFIKNLFCRGKEHKAPENNDFSEFFINAKAKEKAKVIRKVLREANGEQRAMMDEYKKKISDHGKILAN